MGVLAESPSAPQHLVRLDQATTSEKGIAAQCTAPTIGASAALMRAPCSALIIEPSSSR
jgi:hypothetical protein